MIKLLTPWKTYPALAEIEIVEMVSMGIRIILLDMDNTIVPWHTSDVHPANLQWIRKAKEEGMRIYLFSNNNKNRTQKLALALGIEAIWNANKPLNTGFRQIERKVRMKKEEVVIIGDQLFTDILGAGLWGIRSILVTPISQKENRWTQLMRWFEVHLFHRIDKRES